MELDENREVLIETLKGLDLLIIPDQESATDRRSTPTPFTQASTANGIPISPSRHMAQVDSFMARQASPGGNSEHERDEMEITRAD